MFEELGTRVEHGPEVAAPDVAHARVGAAEHEPTE